MLFIDFIDSIMMFLTTVRFGLMSLLSSSDESSLESLDDESSERTMRSSSESSLSGVNKGVAAVGPKKGNDEDDALEGGCRVAAPVVRRCVKQRRDHVYIPARNQKINNF
jgi:hypothetical protein